MGELVGEAQYREDGGWAVSENDEVVAEYDPSLANPLLRRHLPLPIP